MKKEKKSNQFLILGPIKEIVLLGGGKLLVDLMIWSKSKNIKVKVVTSTRHANDQIDNKKFTDYLEDHKIDYFVSKDINSVGVRKFLKKSENSFFLSCGAAWIFKKSVITSLFNNKIFNIHSTGLPQNRGGGGYSWQIMMGVKFGYCTMHLIDEGIDTGPIIENEEFIFPATARKPIDFINLMQKKNFEFIKKFITKNRFNKKEIKLNLQHNYLSTYWPRLNSDLNSWINWSMQDNDLEKFICAFDEPYGGAKTLHNGKIVRIKDVLLSSQDGTFHSYQNGIVYRKGKNWLCVSLKNSSLIIRQVLDEKKNNIFKKIKVGDRFITPFSKLELSYNRITYSSTGIKIKQ